MLEKKSGKNHQIGIGHGIDDRKYILDESAVDILPRWGKGRGGCGRATNRLGIWISVVFTWLSGLNTNDPWSKGTKPLFAWLLILNTNDLCPKGRNLFLHGY